MAHDTASSEMATKSSNSADMTERYINIAKRLLEESQSVISGNVSTSLRFNHGQCAYLVIILNTAVQCAVDCTNISSSDEQPRGQIPEFSENGKLLVRLAMDVRSFIQECCKDEWVQAASMLMNSFEHVASLISHLELCIWTFRNRHRIVLGRELRLALTNISKAHDRRLTESQALDPVNLKNNVEAAWNLESISNPEERQLVPSLLERLETALAVVAEDQNFDLAELSFRDQVNLLNIVEAALNPESIPNPEERHFAASLVERLRIAVANPTPHTSNLALLSILEGEDKRLATGSQNFQIATSRKLLQKLRTTVVNSICDERFLAHLSHMRVDCTTIHRVEKLGKGIADDVYKVKWMGLHAAEKTFPEGKDLLFFDPEVSVLAKLSHPNIVPLLCYAREESAKGESACSIVIELLEKDLSTLMGERLKLDESTRDSSPFTLDEAVDLMLQIAEGMYYLYRKRVLHRDLKSHNILVKCVKLEEVGGVGRVEFVHAKVADFGISKTKEKSITLTHPTWNRAGTTLWMAPELIRVEKRGSFGTSQAVVSSAINNNSESRHPFKSDVYSFGIVCYEILTGSVPFAGITPNDVKKRVWRHERPILPASCPPSLRSMIKKCWRKEAVERPSFADICSELRFMKGLLLIGRDL